MLIKQNDVEKYSMTNGKTSRHQEGRRGSDEVGPEPSVLPSRETAFCICESVSVLLFICFSSLIPHLILASFDSKWLPWTPQYMCLWHFGESRRNSASWGGVGGWGAYKEGEIRSQQLFRHVMTKGFRISEGCTWGRDCTSAASIPIPGILGY